MTDDSCFVCGKPGKKRNFRDINKSDDATKVLCDDCRTLVGRRDNCNGERPSHVVWSTALHRSWLITGKNFSCELTGATLNTEDSSHQLYLTLEHVTPQKTEGGIEVLASVVNDIKGCMDQSEFKRVIVLLAELLTDSKVKGRGSTNAIEKVFKNLKYWKSDGRPKLP